MCGSTRTHRTRLIGSEGLKDLVGGLGPHERLGALFRSLNSPAARYEHIHPLCGEEIIDWAPIEKHWVDLLRAGISIREGRISSVTLLRRLGDHSRRNRLYQALRELGRVIRTITLLRYLSEPGLRNQTPWSARASLSTRTAWPPSRPTSLAQYGASVTGWWTWNHPTPPRTPA